MVKVAIALGSNLGDREAMVRTAAKRLSEEFLQDARLSSLLETEPWGITDQPKFINAVIVGMSEWKAPGILNYLKTLEQELGRKKRVLNGPREIDLDLIAYGEEEAIAPGVTVPHPRMQDRIFVLKPLVELWPDWRHPLLQKTALQLLQQLESSLTP